MAYVKNTWVTGDVPTTTKLKHLETQYDQVKVYIDANLRKNTTLDLVVQTAASAPTATAGRLYFNTATSRFYIADGIAFIPISGVI